MSKSIRHIPSLDGIRAISFLLVFVAHAGLEKYLPGGLGVTVFFFLSGFLITTLLRAEYAKNSALNFRHFWLRRGLRILPPFYLVLAATTLGALMFDPPGTLSGPAVTAEALQYTNYWIILHGYGGQPAGTGVYWSLAVEEHFYIVFPWLFVGLQRCKIAARNQALALWGLCLLILLWRCVLVFGLHVAEDRTYMASDTRIDSILFGCALALWHSPVLDDVGLNERRWKFVYVPAALLLMTVCFVFRVPEFRETARYSLQGAALTILFIAAIRYSHWAVFRWLNSRLLNFIGLLSYSLYLLHYAVLFAVQRAAAILDPVSQGVLALAVSVTIAWVIYERVEKPCARLRKRLSD